MKKFFALVLALAMVLTASGAFASVCTGGFDWTKVTLNNCGQGTIEVIPYVKVNDGCGGYNWVVNECAGAVVSEDVFYAIRLTIEGAPDPEWWDAATVTVEYDDGLVQLGEPGNITQNLALLYDEDEADATTFYYDFENTTWREVGTGAGQIEVDDDVEENRIAAYANTRTGSQYIRAARVIDAREAEVCATLASDAGDFTDGVVGNYYVYYASATNSVWVYEDEDDFNTAMAGQPQDTALAVFADGTNNDDVVSVNWQFENRCNAYVYDQIIAYFGLTIGTPLDQDLVNSNFGWDDEIEDCFPWGSAATAIIDSTCEISIPKTGDVSVIAYAVMALVAAAGAVGLKK